MKDFLNLNFGRRRFLRSWKAVSIGLLLRLGVGASEKQVKRKYFNVPEGQAIKTLKLAAKQAKVEILLPADVLKGVRTRKIRGTFTPIDVFNFMLEETPLRVVRHEESGVYAIKSGQESKSVSRISDRATGDAQPAK